MLEHIGTKTMYYQVAYTLKVCAENFWHHLPDISTNYTVVVGVVILIFET